MGSCARIYGTVQRSASIVERQVREDIPSRIARLRLGGERLGVDEDLWHGAPAIIAAQHGEREPAASLVVEQGPEVDHAVGADATDLVGLGPEVEQFVDIDRGRASHRFETSPALGDPRHGDRTPDVDTRGARLDRDVEFDSSERPCRGDSGLDGPDLDRTPDPFTRPRVAEEVGDDDLCRFDQSCS